MGISGQATPIAVVVRIIELRRLGWSMREVMRELDLHAAVVARYGRSDLVAKPNALAVIIEARAKMKAAVAAKRAAARKASGSRMESRKTISKKIDGSR